MDIRICVSCGAKSFEDKGDYLRCEYCGSEYDKPVSTQEVFALGNNVYIDSNSKVKQVAVGKNVVQISGSSNVVIRGDLIGGNKITRH